MDTASQSKYRTVLFGLLNKKERWGLSWRGVLAGLLILLAGGTALFFTIQPFLAVTRPVPAEYLVVEGWCGKPVCKQAMAEFRAGHYKKVFVTGIPRPAARPADDGEETMFVAPMWLRSEGLPDAQMELVLRPQVMKDRTYSSARALRELIEARHLPVSAVNVVTSSCHARRTWLMFREALGPSIQTGIIAARNPYYDPKRWWHYSEGVREVINETVAYLYAILIFRPETIAPGK